MKYIVLALVSLGLFAGSFGKIEESVYVNKLDSKIVKLISSQPHLTIDHMDNFGFEVYGPKGTTKWLNKIGASVRPLKQHTHTKDLANYPSYEEITSSLKKLVKKYPKIAKLFSIGKSVEGRELWVVKISDNVDTDEVEPEFKYISSMHGDEITGRELTQYLIRDILEGYATDSRMKALVDNTEIFIMPSMNPDGSKARRRANANGYDLNRNFPNWTAGEPDTWQGRQPETQAVMKFQKSRNFALSANFHGGSVCVNYPWDSKYDRHPLDKLLIDLSLVYADKNPAMVNSTDFDRGITNGADWYVLKGGMQDWSYIWYNDLQVTIELSNTKWPRYSKIPSFYDDNKDSMISYLESVHRGAGFTLDSKESGEVQIINSDTNKDLGKFDYKNGEFYKVLPVGSYEMLVNTKTGQRVFTVQVQDKTILNNGNYAK